MDPATIAVLVAALGSSALATGASQVWSSYILPKLKKRAHEITLQLSDGSKLSFKIDELSQEKLAAEIDRQFAARS